MAAFIAFSSSIVLIGVGEYREPSIRILVGFGGKCKSTSCDKCYITFKMGLDSTTLM
jgi:hypothetical protein